MKIATIIVIFCFFWLEISYFCSDASAFCRSPTRSQRRVHFIGEPEILEPPPNSVFERVIDRPDWVALGETWIETTQLLGWGDAARNHDGTIAEMTYFEAIRFCQTLSDPMTGEIIGARAPTLEDFKRLNRYTFWNGRTPNVLLVHEILPNLNAKITYWTSTKHKMISHYAYYFRNFNLVETSKIARHAVRCVIDLTEDNFPTTSDAYQVYCWGKDITAC